MKKKTILWIEDFDIKSSKNVRTKNDKHSDNLMEKLLIFNEKYRNQVEIKKDFLSGVQYIMDHHGEYDCVILDIDMNKNMQSIVLQGESEESRIWNAFFSKVNLKLGTAEKEGNSIVYTINDNPAEKYIEANAGFFLVLLLKSLGFPQDRIAIFSAYGGKNVNDTRAIEWERIFSKAFLHIPKIIDKGDNWTNGKCHQELNEFLMRKYDESDYYKTRMFVYEINNQFDDYFEKIEKYNNNCPLFNYYCKNKDKNIKIEYLSNMLDSLMMYFPYYEQPNQTVYMNVLKLFAEPFDADYDSKKALSTNFRVIKLFRNWSSHNLFSSEEKMDGEIFRFIYFIECLLFIECPLIEDQKSNTLKEYNMAIEFIDSLWNRVRWFICGDYEIQIKKDIQSICKDLENTDWKICEKYEKLPGNMIDVYDYIGRKETVYLKYIMDAYMNNRIENNITYDKNSFRTDYTYLDSTKNQEMNKELFYRAYCIYKTLSI